MVVRFPHYKHFHVDYALRPWFDLKWILVLHAGVTCSKTGAESPGALVGVAGRRQASRCRAFSSTALTHPTKHLLARQRLGLADSQRGRRNAIV